MSDEPVSGNEEPRSNAEVDREDLLGALKDASPESSPLVALSTEEQGHPVTISATDIQPRDILGLPEIDKHPVLVEQVIQGNIGAVRVVVQYTGARRGQTDHVELDWGAEVTRLGRL